MKRIVSIWLNDWPMDRLRRLPDAPDRDENVFVLIANQTGTQHITAANARARAVGIAPGDRLADARACVRDLLSEPAHPAADANALRQLAVWMIRWTPSVAIDGIDGLFLDITGCPHLFGGERAMLADISERLSRAGIAHRLAVADTPGAAWALARWANGKTVICAPGKQVDALAPLPVQALRLSVATVDTLARFGLSTIAHLTGISRAAFTRRCSGIDSVVMRLDQAFSRHPEPLAFIRPSAPERVLLPCPEPLRHTDGLRSALETLLSRLCARLKRDGRGARELSFLVFRADGQVRTITVRMAWPVSDPTHAARLFEERLSSIDAGEGVDCLLLEATHSEPVRAATGTLSPQWQEKVDTKTLGRLLNTLAMRTRVRIAKPQASHVPERSETRAPVNLHLAHPWPDTPMSPRPFRLLTRPEPVDALAELPDSAPVRFIWRRIAYRIVRADGPERIASEWWHGSSSKERARDYYRLEDSEGQRFWLFRLWDETPAPRWYMHGLFA